MELQNVLETRYSCRDFLPQAPTSEQLEAVLAAGRLAPTACNSQAVHTWVATAPETIAALDAATPCRYGAPVVLVLGYDEDTEPVHSMTAGEEPWSFGELDVTSVLVHMALKASDLGLATCWLGAFDGAKVRELLGIPQNIRIRALLDLGTPADTAKGQPGKMHSARKPLSETTTWV